MGGWYYLSQRRYKPTREAPINISNRVTSIVMLLTVALFWGLNWPAVKFMMTELPPFTVRAVAFPTAALLLAVIALLQGASLRPTKAERVPLLVSGVFVIFGFNMLTSLGQSLTETSHAVIIAYTMPVMTAVLSAIFLKERVDSKIVAALVLSMLGLVILASNDLLELIKHPAASLVMLAAALSWSIGNVMIKAHPWQLAPAALASWFFAISAMLAWPVALIFEDPLSLQWPSLAVKLTLVFHIICPMVICYLLWNVLLKRLPLTVAAISLLTAPIIGVLSSVVLLGDTLTWQKCISLTLIVASIVVVQRPRGSSYPVTPISRS
ncbi:MAG: drug/metabolite transporter (DMT)-like permease [Halioglobus sp.]|jgi:drug/metabolite transporter (DMT)-like permease